MASSVIKGVHLKLNFRLCPSIRDIKTCELYEGMKAHIIYHLKKIEKEQLDFIS